MKKNKLLYLILWCCFTGSLLYASPEPLTLWYKTPAKDWMREALPLGNGYMGVMFFGGIGEEQLQFSEGSLWSGGPHSNAKYNYGNRPGAWKYLPEVRKLIDQAKYEEAEELLAQQMIGYPPNKKSGDKTEWGDFGAQQTMGSLSVKVGHKEVPVTNYRRELDITHSLGKISYEINGNHYVRTYFGNYPKGVMVYHFQSDQSENYEIAYSTPQKKLKESFTKNRYVFTGEVPDNHQKFQTAYQIISDGNVTYSNGKVKISSAKYFYIMHTAATDYVMKYPSYKGNDYQKQVNDRLSNAQLLSYQQLLDDHKTDYKKLFERVSFNIMGDNRSDLPTDERQILFSKTRQDKGFEALYFQYGRYLMISASRPGTMPMHLQGKWNNSTNPVWAADYHTNINLQMLYWPAEVTNLAECHEPLIDYVKSLVEPGKKSASDFFHTRGWMVNTMNNAYGYTGINWELPWGFFPGGAAWLSQHVWEHYSYKQDVGYLKNTAYPIMKDAALFWMDYLSLNKNGFLVSSPSFSPEQGGVSGGASMDHQIAWDLLNNCVQAAAIVKDYGFQKEAEKIRDKILPPTIGHWGQLQEWKEDIDDPNNKHRHISHLFALYPGNQISPSTTPKLSEAAKKTLVARGDAGTGWSLAWKINFWARLKDGNHALELYKTIMMPAKIGDKPDASGSYSNLLDAHPPFQLDGNMGATAGVAEMLLQSQTGTIDILPALPDDWGEGEIKGLKARGGFTVDIKWKNGKLEEASIESLNNKEQKIMYAGKSVTLNCLAGNKYSIKLQDFH